MTVPGDGLLAIIVAPIAALDKEQALGWRKDES